MLGTSVSTCINNELIKNTDIECGANHIWHLFTQNNAVASLTEATPNNSKNNKSLNVNVTNAGNSFNEVILKNSTINNDTFSNKTIEVSVFAKASTPQQQFKFRIKTISNGVATFNASNSFSVSSTNFEQYKFNFTIPSNTTSIEFQVLCGKISGEYYFDDFSIQGKVLSVENVSSAKNIFKTYPNPVNQYLNVESSKKIKKIILYTINNKHFELEILHNRIDLTKFNTGVYFLRTFFEDNTFNHSKIAIN
ncbi:T9SS type A sorting domain-containing protein [Polaribacter batillariae]|uniref:T9SS type A sorting domain-containing protein n=1 Tax=Polaribacter batillariae TaxID=2808900 RepID=UPI001FB0DA15|nr:T9SS type A sorting domain-containing protein [Polaribacter batillariae]